MYGAMRGATDSADGSADRVGRSVGRSSAAAVQVFTTVNRAPGTPSRRRRRLR